MPETAVVEPTGTLYVLQSGKYAGQTVQAVLNSDPGYLPKFLIKAKNESDILAVKQALAGDAVKTETAVGMGEVEPETGKVEIEPDVPADADKGYKPPNLFPDGKYMGKNNSILVQARRMTEENRKAVNPKTQEPIFGNCPDMEVGKWCLVMPLGHKESLSDQVFKSSYIHRGAFDGLGS